MKLQNLSDTLKDTVSGLRVVTPARNTAAQGASYARITVGKVGSNGPQHAKDTNLHGGGGGDGVGRRGRWRGKGSGMKEDGSTHHKYRGGTGKSRGGSSVKMNVNNAHDVQENREIVSGVRRVWGTLKSATCSTVKNTIAKLSRVKNVNQVRVKRKYKSSQSGKDVWWFVLQADETSILQSLEAGWETVSLQTGWHLEPCTRPVSVANTLSTCTAVVTDHAENIPNTPSNQDNGLISNTPSNQDNGHRCSSQTSPIRSSGEQTTTQYDTRPEDHLTLTQSTPQIPHSPPFLGLTCQETPRTSQ